MLRYIWVIKTFQVAFALCGAQGGTLGYWPMAKWPGSHRASSKHPAQGESPLVLGMDGIFFHHSQAGLLFAVHKVF